MEQTFSVTPLSYICPYFIPSSLEGQNGEEPIFSSDFQQNDDLVASLLAKKIHQQGVKNGGEEGFRSVSSTFAKWNGSSSLPCLQPQKSQQALHKRCIRFLKCINDHRMSPFDERHGGRVGTVNKHDDYDKLAIHHVVAERKRREEMSQMFSALRELLPVNPKGKAPVLLQTIDYVAHLKQRVEQLERRNGELEALLHQRSHLY
ncbi:transcription factor BHLH42 isoform X2 [Cryptomeria japonica]|uniref:transcription factor BHLH42 isoform X2 n=1 Tax=Cryptomeria japonica TaxID=3369 RepID=UPI0025AD8958|nr:transcription factor BHLH42 isoform X2 [Cryptomeria japonica]